MVKRLIEMIQEYQASVIEAALLFEKYKDIAQSELARSRFEGFPREGFLDPEQTIEYNFHGIGLCVTFPNRDIDWDFGYDGRLDGFDMWRLWIFATQGTNHFPEFKEKETLEKAFKEAENLGIFHKQFKHFQDDLYYLSSTE
ncbi:MAG TPA: hypothetical protein VF556_02720 [Pyrinomonadaceae bacterium]|jgi:hypothetical protein